MRSPIIIKGASWLVLGLFCVTFAISLFVPIYSDEIVVKIAPVRVLLDGFELISLLPQCGSASSSYIPLTWIPGAAIDWAIYGNLTEPILLRIVGMSAFVVWLGMMLWLLLARLRTEISSLHIVAGLIAFVTLGVLPFLLVLNRSEQPLLLGITLICILPYIVAQYQPRTNLVWILLLVIFLITTSYMFSSHPKTFFFIPLLLASAVHLSVASKRLWIGVILLAGLTLICYENLVFSTNGMSCPNAPLLDEILKSQSLSIGTLFETPKEFFLAGMHNLAHSYKYFKNVLFEWHYQSDWLPSSHDQKQGWFSGLIDVVVSLIYLSTVGYVAFSLVKKLRTSLKEGKLVAGTTIPLALSAGIISCGFLLASKNFYESSLILPLLFLLVVLLLPAKLKEIKDCRVCTFIFITLLFASIISQFNLILTFTPYISNSWMSGGQVDGQELSISPFNYIKTRSEVIDAAANCDIKVGALNQHLVIDDSTYFPFKDSYRPFHILYVARAFGKDIGDRNFFPFLKEKNSAGVITSCGSLSPELLKFSKKHSNYCCISRQDINTLGSNIQNENK
jgi:hypothetical protein